MYSEWRSPQRTCYSLCTALVQCVCVCDEPSPPLFYIWLFFFRANRALLIIHKRSRAREPRSVMATAANKIYMRQYMRDQNTSEADARHTIAKQPWCTRFAVPFRAATTTQSTPRHVWRCDICVESNLRDSTMVLRFFVLHVIVYVER